MVRVNEREKGDGEKEVAEENRRNGKKRRRKRMYEELGEKGKGGR
jgi:hypothetical protein